MKKKTALLTIGFGTVFLFAWLMVSFSRAQRPALAPRITGPLSATDATEIEQVVLRERAPLSGEYAPRGIVGWGRRLRERVYEMKTEPQAKGRVSINLELLRSLAWTSYRFFIGWPERRRTINPGPVPNRGRR